MTKQSKKNDQHIVPRTYLKYWRIHSGNFVYGIDFSNNYRTGVQKFGLNDKVFKRKKYYNLHSLDNPYSIEDFFGNDIEPHYDSIMSEVSRERDLSFDARVKIMEWLFVSKMRSPHMRDSVKGVAEFLYNASELYKGNGVSPEKSVAIKKRAEIISKEVQLVAFTDAKKNQSLLELFFSTLNAKHWRILKSYQDLEFWTNDNPGFSPNIVERFAKDYPYHHVMELNASYVIFYPLSPNYCLEISPFLKGTSLNICSLTMEIKYEQASIGLIEFINRGVLYTCNNVLVSNNLGNFGTLRKGGET